MRAREHPPLIRGKHWNASHHCSTAQQEKLNKYARCPIAQKTYTLAMIVAKIFLKTKFWKIFAAIAAGAIHPHLEGGKFRAIC